MSFTKAIDTLYKYPLYRVNALIYGHRRIDIFA